jgi:D-amino-acid dehydrogenase
MSGPGRRVVVVGGGVIGAACAHYLARDGWSVSVIDRGDFGRGCSHANCGLVCPSHILPLAAPGVLPGALASLLRPDSPFRIKPRFDPALWAWFYRFARRCNTRDMLEAARAIQSLLDSSRRLFDELLQEEKIECEWEARGLLFVMADRRTMDHHERTIKTLRESFHLSPVRYDGDELTRLEPALKPGLAGGWLHPTDAHLRPDRLMASWRLALESRGVAVHANCEMKGFVPASGTARAVVTSRGELPADAFVVAAGAWTPLLARHLGCRVPIQPGKGYSITFPRPAVCPTFPLILEAHHVAVTPMRSGYRLGSTMEFAGYDDRLDPRRLDLLRRGAAHYLREPYGDVVEEEWFGWRPMTYDGKPVVDRSPVLANVWVAAGHNMLGLSMAPATGKLVAELLGGREPHLDPGPYRLSRF